MSDQQNTVNVLGVGECGTQVALELAAGYELGAIQEMVVPFLPRKVNFRLRFWRNSKQDSERPGQAPHFFVGDFNRVNLSYLRAKCLTILNRIRSEYSHETDEQTLKRYKQDVEAKSLGLNDEDVKEVLKKLKKHGFAPQVEVLDFYSGNQLLIAPQGAGGYQYLSEAITNANSALVEKVGRAPSRMLFGIFGLGGGSGAGSAFSILSNDPLRGTRVNLGIGILPSFAEGSFWRNSGRFICRYLSADRSQRFTSLACISNRAADLAGSFRGRDIPGQEELRIKTIRAHTNRFISQFVYFLSLANSQDVRAHRGKALDTSDMMRYLSPIASFGFSERSFEGVDFDEMFVRALSPMRIEDDNICGLSCAISTEADNVDEIIGRLRNHFKANSQTSVQDAADVIEISKLTGFYRTITRVWALFFVADPAADNEVMRSHNRIVARLRSLTGSNTEVITSTYVSPRIKTDALLLIVDGGVSIDLADAVEAYVNGAFLGDDPVKSNQFKRIFRQHLARIREIKRSEEREEVKESFTTSWNGLFPQEVTKERTTEADLEYMRNHKFVPDEIRNPDRNPYLLTTGKVLNACLQLLHMSAAYKTPSPEEIELEDKLPPV